MYWPLNSWGSRRDLDFSTSFSVNFNSCPANSFSPSIFFKSAIKTSTYSYIVLKVLNSYKFDP